ncbi:DUF2690 domain-containing protein [Micromonospora sp. NPDC047557]|uniref:DUF2690 domain-containing protein n=1 Tax=Micromonospora sp. NPDC047557 TaxID=3364250 RepID=UPI003719F3A7
MIVTQNRSRARRLTTRVAAALAAVTVGLTVGLIGGQPASAATSGCGSVCDGKDPDTYIATVDGKYMRCGYLDNAYTKYTATYVELRYSTFCRTAWARQTGSFGYMSGVLVQSFDSSGSLRKQYDNLRTSGSWSAMVNDKGYTARACFYQYDEEIDQVNDKKHILYCTAKF